MSDDIRIGGQEMSDMLDRSIYCKEVYEDLNKERLAHEQTRKELEELQDANEKLFRYVSFILKRVNLSLGRAKSIRADKAAISCVMEVAEIIEASRQRNNI